MHVLLVEDDAATAKNIELMLEAEGMRVYVADQGEEGLSVVKHYEYDIILLDLGLPDMSGITLLKLLRESGDKTPIIIVTGRYEIECKVECLMLGADDYVTKPFHKDELLARMHAVVRRSKGLAKPTVVIGNLVLNLQSKTITVDGERVHFTPKEYQTLELLLLRQGVALTNECFLNHLYNGMDERSCGVVRAYVSRVRAKLKLFGAVGVSIVTLQERGFIIYPVVSKNLQHSGI